jgi:hypothetical protein
VRLTDFKRTSLLVLTPLLMAGWVMASSDDPAPNTKTKTMTNAMVAADSSSTSTSNNASKIDLPVPVGEPVKGIKIPQYDEKGNLTMSLTADVAQKLDERQVELTKLKVLFNDKEQKEIVVEIPHSMLDLESKKLIADSETVITREDFEITGQTAEFDTVARKGIFKGHVRASFRNDNSPILP